MYQLAHKRGCVRAAMVSLIMVLGAVGGTNTTQAEDYRVSYLPKAKNNVICFSPDDSRKLLEALQPMMVAEKRPRPRKMLRSLEPEFGTGSRFNCLVLKSRFLPAMPLDVVELENDGEGWGPHDPQYFIAAEILVNDQRYVAGADGETLYVHVPHGVIEKK